MEFSRQEYQSGLPFPSPRDLPDPGIEPGLGVGGVGGGRIILFSEAVGMASEAIL